MTVYEIDDGPKMLKETLCVAQTAIGNSPYFDEYIATHINRLQRLINECERIEDESRI